MQTTWHHKAGDSMARLAIVLLAGAGAWLGAGCVDALECGEGTLEQGGVCVSADSSKDPASCGQGTYFDPATQTCVSDFEPVRCDEGTTIEVTEDGVTVCVGVGGGGDCSAPIACPSPSPGKVTVCGRLIDAGTGQPVQADGVSTAACDPDTPAATGPCALEVTFYDAITFANDPQNAPPLGHESLVVDECGRFRASNVDPPVTLGFMGVSVDDHAQSGRDDHVLSGVAFPATDGAQIPGIRLLAVATATDQAWTTSAGDPFGGMSFSQKGAFLAIFRHGDERVAGVQLTGANNQTRPEDTFYFSDADPLIISTVAPGQTATGVNGAGLMVNSSLTEHSGQDGEVSGCQWPSNLAAAIPGLIYAQELIMETSAGEACP
jgi:hypothetical protein